MRNNRIIKTGLALAAAVMMLPVGATAQVKLGANNLIGKIGYGMYTMTATQNPGFTRVAETLPLFGGAVYVNGKYYGCYYDYEYVAGEPKLTEVSWHVYDAVTWQEESKVDCPLDYTYIASDRTYDPSTGKVYSLVYDKSATAVWLATTNLQTGASTMIAPVGNDVFTIASDANGRLYGINSKAALYTINPTNGATTLVGNTNIMEGWENDYQQSMTFDYATGKLYWAEFHALGIFDSAAAIYEINPATAASTKICDLPGGPELTGLYVIPALPAGSPGAASGLAARTRSTGSTDVRFSFTAPTHDVDGKTLNANEDITFELYVDSDLIDIAGVKPGASYTSSYITIGRGLHSYKVTGSNAKGSGETAAITFFSGYDVPQAPQNVTMTSDGVNATVSWTVPAAGGNQGGPVRTPFTYNVVRYPGAVKVATGISELTVTDTPTEPGRYHYTVSASSQDGEGPATESNSLVIATYETPYYCGFDTQADFDLYTVVDIASQGKVWNYDEDNARLRHPWGLDHSIDDYIMTPAIRLDGDKSYSVSFDAYQMVDMYDEHVMLYYGTEPDINKMTLILDTKKLNGEPTNYSAVVAALRNGTHYFAFRSKTGPNGFMSYVDNVRIVSEGMATAPSAVTDLTAKAADGGKTEVTISFTAPEKNLKGDALASIEAIDIIRGEGDEPIKTFLNPQPGQQLEWTDSSVRTGKYTYRVIAENANGKSQEATVEVFAGVDTPKPVEDLTLDYADQTVISWTAPKEGVNGGNLNGLLTYKIERYVNSVPETVEADWTETTFTDTWQTPVQAYVYYAVTAQTTAGASEAKTTEGYTAGDNYTLPFAESFAGGKCTNNPWMVEQIFGNEGSWKIVERGEDPYVSAQDGDGGLATFDGYHTFTKNCELRLISPSISFKYHTNLFLTFHAYHYNGNSGWWSEEFDPVEETFCIEASVDGGKFEKVADSDFATYAETNGWQQHTVSLEKYAKLDNVRIAFRGKSAGCFNIHIDNIAISGTNAVGALEEGDAVLTAGEGIVTFRSLEAPLAIYATDGRTVATTTETEGTITLPSGIYVARSGGKTWKFIVK